MEGRTKEKREISESERVSPSRGRCIERGASIRPSREVRMTIDSDWFVDQLRFHS